MQAQNRPQTTHELDLRKIDPAERNIRIFQAFESVHPGTMFILIDNKDLKDIHKQFDHDFPGQFRWKELQKGPDLWRVKIGKLDGMQFEL